jgi:hypothetical protein
VTGSQWYVDSGITRREVCRGTLLAWLGVRPVTCTPNLKTSTGWLQHWVK